MASPLVTPLPPPMSAPVNGVRAGRGGAADPLAGVPAADLARAVGACAANLPPLNCPSSPSPTMVRTGRSGGGVGGVCRRGRPSPPAPVPGAAAVPAATDAHVADAYTFMAALPSPPAPWSRAAPPRALPPQPPGGRGRPTLVLDLDETLVHSALQPPRGFLPDGSPVPSTCVYVPVASGVAAGAGSGRGGSVGGRTAAASSTAMRVYVRVRPGVTAFLTEMARLYEVVLFTAAQRAYADKVVDRLDPTGLLTARLCRESCVPVGDGLVKDLGVLGRDRARMVIVDNLPSAFGWDVPNGVPINTWVGDPNDTALADLIPLLTTLATLDDVRPLLTATFGVQERVDVARAVASGVCGSPMTPDALSGPTHGGFASPQLPAARWIVRPQPILGRRRVVGGSLGRGAMGGNVGGSGGDGGSGGRGIIPTAPEGSVHGGASRSLVVPPLALKGTDLDADSLSSSDSDDDGAEADVEDCGGKGTPPSAPRSEADADAAAMDGVMNMDGLPASPGDLGRLPRRRDGGGSGVGRRSSAVGGVPRPMSAPAPCVSPLLSGSGGVQKRVASPLFAAACGAAPSWRQRPSW